MPMAEIQLMLYRFFCLFYFVSMVYNLIIIEAAGKMRWRKALAK